MYMTWRFHFPLRNYDFKNAKRMEVVCLRRKRGPKCTMLKDRDYDVTPYIIAHMYPQMHQGSANSARCIVEMGDCWRRGRA